MGIRSDRRQFCVPRMRLRDGTSRCPTSRALMVHDNLEGYSGTRATFGVRECAVVADPLKNTCHNGGQYPSAEVRTEWPLRGVG
jgi:hypothetical protein